MNGQLKIIEAHKYFQGKLILLFFTTIFLKSCSPCNNFDTSDFINNLGTFENVKNIILKKGLINSEQKNLSLDVLKKDIEIYDYKILKALKLSYIYKINDVLILKFSTIDNSKGIENRIDNKLDLHASIKCNYYLFFNKNKNKRHNVATYERYVECSKNFIYINKDWTFIQQNKPCAD